MKNGTGSEYDKNGNIIFKGEYINDIRKESWYKF
jgi:antitoxin component YwqK of YwqJK toxin-antitoxin module